MRIEHFIADQIRRAHTDTIEVRHAMVASTATDRKPLANPPAVSIYELFSREVHECAHAVAALEGGARNIVVTIGADARGSCCFDPIRKSIDHVVVCLVGVIAEVRLRPSALAVYAGGCFDFNSARLLLDMRRERNEWPHMGAEGAAQRATDFVSVHWERIVGLALVLGRSGGTLCDADVRHFAKVSP